VRAAWNAVMALFENFVYVVVFYTLIAPALPWFLARGRSGAETLNATGLALLLLGLFHVLLWPACVAANCGQGAILVAMLWVIGVVSAMLTLLVGGLVAYSRK
jgi:hypothetical protein